jgi:NADH-quinone oxidoreductase subunit B
MKHGSFYLLTIGKVMEWARANSLWYASTGSACCADEVLSGLGCRYDLERFGCLPELNPRQADLLIVSGATSRKAAPYLKAVYDEMLAPKYVMAVGACSCAGGLFGPEYSYATIPSLDELLPVDVYVPGCPPRPEAIMDGLLRLQGQIQGRARPKEETWTASSSYNI